MSRSYEVDNRFCLFHLLSDVVAMHILVLHTPGILITNRLYLTCACVFFGHGGPHFHF